jgi:hypothetical protein
LQKLRHLLAKQLLLQEKLAAFIDSVILKDTLGQIHPDRRNLQRGRLRSLKQVALASDFGT